MRDTRNEEFQLSDMEVFNQFKEELRVVLEQNGYTLKYEMDDKVAIPYKGGFLEIFYYDRPSNPVIENGILTIDWSLVGVSRKIAIELYK